MTSVGVTDLAVETKCEKKCTCNEEEKCDCACMELSYWFKFHAPPTNKWQGIKDVPITRPPWIKGGKLPGLKGGADVSGNKVAKAKNGEGFSLRPMWRGDGRFELYAYYASMPDKSFGQSIKPSYALMLRPNQEY